MAAQGIEEPIFDVEVTLKSGATHGFQVGTSMPMGGLVQSSSGATGYVPEPVLAMLNQGPNHVADPDAFPFSASETMAITIEIDGKVLNIVASNLVRGGLFRRMALRRILS